MNRPTPPSRQPTGAQFSLRTLMLVMLMLSVLAAVFGGLVQGGPRRITFILIGVAAPVGVMLLLGIGRAIGRLIHLDPKVPRGQNSDHTSQEQ